MKNMKGWSHKKIILYLFCSFDLLRKKVENNFFIRAAVLCANISQIFFSQFDHQKYLRCLFMSLFNLSPHFFTSFSTLVRIQTDSGRRYSFIQILNFPNPSGLDALCIVEKSWERSFFCIRWTMTEDLSLCFLFWLFVSLSSRMYAIWLFHKSEQTNALGVAFKYWAF